jgi:hypothetical protein
MNEYLRDQYLFLVFDFLYLIVRDFPVQVLPVLDNLFRQTKTGLSQTGFPFSCSRMVYSVTVSCPLSYERGGASHTRAAPAP